MDLMVLPSWREGFPNAVLEAAACGVPVIASCCTGSRDAVVPGVTGFLVPAGDPGAISHAVLGLFQAPDRCKRISSAARSWVMEKYDEQKVLGMTVDLYLRIIAPAPAQTLEGQEPVTGLTPAL
jgi:glycosyltransferase involved in cell wall biosynthesis